MSTAQHEQQYRGQKWFLNSEENCCWLVRSVTRCRQVTTCGHRVRKKLSSSRELSLASHLLKLRTGSVREFGDEVVLKVHVQKSGNISILRLQGRIVIGEADVLSNAVESQGNASAVVLDLARVSRIDAGGLGVLLRVREQLESRGIEFRIMNVTRLIQQVLEMTKLNAVFEVTRERDLNPMLRMFFYQDLIQPGLSPVQRLKARENDDASEKPSR